VTAQDIDRLFGGRFAARLGELPVGRWSGPVTSGCGLHLVLVQERIQAREPELGEIRDAVADEWRVTRRDEANQAFYESLRARHQVTVERPAASSLPTWSWRLAPYGIGTVAMYWTIERVLAFAA
jgi:hypothetical protein